MVMNSRATTLRHIVIVITIVTVLIVLGALCTGLLGGELESTGGASDPSPVTRLYN